MDALKCLSCVVVVCFRFFFGVEVGEKSRFHDGVALVDKLCVS